MSNLKYNKETSNLGGINEFKFIYEEELAGSFEVINGQAHDITVLSDFNAPDIIPESAYFNEEGLSGGFIYHFAASIAKDELEKLQAAKKLDAKKIIAIVTDNNGQSRLLGCKGNGCIVFLLAVKDKKVGSINGYILQIEWRTRNRAPFTDGTYAKPEQYQFEDGNDYLFEDSEAFFFND